MIKCSGSLTKTETVLSKTMGDSTAISKTVGSFDCGIASSGSVRLRVSSNLYLRITVLETNCEWLILCVVIFFCVLLTSERCFVCDLVQTECVVRV